MLKKLLTGCLTIAMAAALAAPAMAAEMSGKVGGRAVADLYTYSKTPVVAGEAGDAYSYMDMASEARLDYTLTATEGDWKVTGKVELRSNNKTDAYTNPVVLQKFVKLENDAFSIGLGTQWWGFVYLTPYMGVSGTWDRACYGCGDDQGNNVRADRLIVGIKQVGLQLYYASTKEDFDLDGDGTKETTGVQKTDLGLQYNGNFGPIALVASYLSQSYKAIENFGTAKDGVLDGATYSEIAFALRYGISEGMFVEFDYETEATTLKDADPDTTVMMGLAFAMAFSEVQGIAVAYDTWTNDNATTDDTDDDTVSTKLTFTFNQKIAGQQMFVGYNSLSEKTGEGDASAEAVLALGARVNF